MRKPWCASTSRRRGEPCGPGNADASRKNVVLPRGDPGQQVAIDRAHDAGGHQPPRILRRQRGVGASELLACAECLSFEQGRDRRCEVPGLQIVFGHAVGRQFVERQVEAAARQIGRHVAQDVGQLEGQAQFLGVAAGARILVAEDLDADEADRGGDLVAVGPKIAEGGETHRLEIHRTTVDELLEGQPLDRKATNHSLQRLALRRARTPAIEAGGHFLTPALQSGRPLPSGRSSCSSTSSSTARQKSHTAVMASRRSCDRARNE